MILDDKYEILLKLLSIRMIEEGGREWGYDENPTEMIEVKIPVGIKKLWDDVFHSELPKEVQTTVGKIQTEIFSMIINVGLGTLSDEGGTMVGVKDPDTSEEEVHDYIRKVCDVIELDAKGFLINKKDMLEAKESEGSGIIDFLKQLKSISQKADNKQDLSDRLEELFTSLRGK